MAMYIKSKACTIKLGILSLLVAQMANGQTVNGFKYKAFPEFTAEIPPGQNAEEVDKGGIGNARLITFHSKF